MEVVEHATGVENAENLVPSAEPRSESERLSSNRRRRLIEKIAVDSLNLAGDNRSRRHLTAMLISKLSQYANLPEDEISLFSSAERIFEVLVNAVCLAGDEILVCEASSGRMRDSAIMTQMIRVQSHYGYSPFSADSRSIEDQLSEKTRLIFLENPNHTTGTVYSRGELVHLLEHAGEAIVVLDESYVDYIGTGVTDLLGEYANLVVVRRFPVLAGLNVEPLGYIMTNREIMRYLTNAEKSGDLTIHQLATAIAVNNNIQYIREHIEAVQENIIYLSARLRGLGVS
ncbi:MAG: aminotransferase class I/II-fold pyridoxal phosphate-dependent enzyme, partial [Candidatus Zixiibacteriota bacterium]